MTRLVDEQAWTEEIGSFVKGLKWRCTLFERDEDEAKCVARFALEHGLSLDQITNLVWVIATPEVYRMDQGEKQVLLALAGEPMKLRGTEEDLPF